MCPDSEDPATGDGGRGGRAPYTRYRARRRLWPGRGPDPRQDLRSDEAASPEPVGGQARTGYPPPPSGPTRGRRPLRLPHVGGPRWARLLRRLGTRKRILLALIGLIVGWIVLSLALFLISSHFERTSLQGNVGAVLDPAGSPLTSANNVLVLGSDRRPKNSKEPGAETTGYGRSDSIMLIRTGGGHAARLSIPRDTVVEIPPHGLQKINAAHAYGGAAGSVSVLKRWLGIPINHVIEVNFEDFPALIDAMGGVDFTGPCIVSRLDGGFSQGGYTLRLRAGTHHIDGRQALAIARTRENLCRPNENDLQREEHQQAIFNAVKHRLLSVSSFFRLPWIAWNAPKAIISDMSGPELMEFFGGLAISGTPPTRVLKFSGAVTLAEGSVGDAVSEAEKRKAVAEFLSG